MVQRIYTSHYAPVPIHERSVFTHLFAESQGKIGGYPASHPAYIDAATGTTISRAQLKHLALTIAHGLRHHPRTRQLGVTRGSTVMLFAPNSLAWPVVLFSTVAAGLRCTLANSAYTAHELAYQFSDSGATLALVNAGGVPVVRAMLAELGYTPAQADARIVVLPSGLGWAGGPEGATSREPGLLTVEDLLATGTLAEEEKFTGSQVHETLYLCYSSGTTGKPKGVETTHQNITSQIDMNEPAFIPMESTRDLLLGVLPFYHIYGLVEILHYPLSIGVPIVVQARFDATQFCANIERYRITAAIIVPPVLVVLARHEAVDRYDLSTLRFMVSGAAPLGAALVKQVTDRLRARQRGPRPTTCTIIQLYGLTETSPTTHILPQSAAARKGGSIGALLPNLEARLVVDGEGAGNEDAREGEPGELWLRGPTVMKGYLNNRKATVESITPEGWFRTGDVVVRDEEGLYFVVDRRKELIKYKGYQVPPAELESLLLTHPDIADAAVIGAHSQAQATELPRAYVVHAQPRLLGTHAARAAFARDVQRWVQERVASHKHLRGGVVVIDSVPKSAAGKILRRELRERAKREMGETEAAYAEVKARL